MATSNPQRAGDAAGSDDSAVDVDEWATRLRERTGDGGGCLETSLAAHSTRSRRGVIRGLAAAVSTTLLPTVAIADTDDSPEAETETEADGDADARAIAREATADPQVRAVHREYSRAGYTVDEALVSTVDESALEREVDAPDAVSGDPSDSVVLRYETGDADVFATLVWYDSGEVVGVSGEHVDKSGDGENDHYDLTYHSFEGGTLTTTVTTEENFLGCSDPRPGCIMAIAATYFGMFGACAACAGSATIFVPACAGCISAVGTHLALHTECPWCND